MLFTNPQEETSASGEAEGRWSSMGRRGWDAAAAMLSAVGGLRKAAAASEAAQPTRSGQATVAELSMLTVRYANGSGAYAGC